LALTKEQKRKVVAQYGEWLERSDAFVLAEYTGMTMKDMDELRARVPCGKEHIDQAGPQGC